MLDSETKKKIDNCRDILVGKVPDPKSQVEQITFAMLYKFMSDMDAESEELGGTAKYFDRDYTDYNWNNLLSPSISSFEIFGLYETAIREMPKNENIPQLFRDIFQNAYIPYRDEETLRLFLREINGFTYDHSERLGDAFEYLLSILGSQGDAGQFRTPRHIIDFMVDIIDPKKDESILDPACGTAGFLISAYNYIIKKHDTNSGLASNEVKALQDNIKGYDISPDMVRLSRVNMYLHDIQEPHIDSYDTLTSDSKWDERSDIILANPPFMSPKGGIRPHNRFSIQSNRSEVLFVDYIIEHLTSNGRAAVIVPEGIIFQSGRAYKQLRKILIENYLVVVVSLPSGAFNPYSGVKCSILIFDRVLVKKADKILFVKIENDGYHLGARRSAIEKNDIPIVSEGIKKYLSGIHNGKEFDVEGISQLYEVPRDEIQKSDDFSLNGEKYISQKIILTDFPMVELKKVAIVDWGNTSITKKAYLKDAPYLAVSAAGIDGKIDHYEQDVGVTVVSAIGAQCGTVFFPNDKFTAIKNTIILTPNELIEPKYLFYILQDNPFPKRGSAQPFISKGDTEKMLIPFPPIEIQKKMIAEIESYQKIIDGARIVVNNYSPSIYVNSDWAVDLFLNLISIITPKFKFKNSEFKENGKYPIIDQSSDKIAGYTDDESTLIFNEDGLVIFGDHTCAVKYVDQPFAQGADGIKIIKVDSTKLNSKFLYYYLLVNGVKQDGYKRHFSILKDYKIPLPPIDEQQEIIKKLDEEQEIIENNKKAITIFEDKIKTVMERVWSS